MQNIQRKTREKMFAHIEASLSGSESIKFYCKQNGIAFSTFYYWQKRYWEESEKNTAYSSGGFIPINVEPDPACEVENKGSVELHFLFPNRVQVKCPDTVNPQVLKALLTQ